MTIPSTISSTSASTISSTIAGSRKPGEEAERQLGEQTRGDNDEEVGEVDGWHRR
jgi:hypothetical protein